MVVISTIDCFASRYTVPKKFKGTESWKSKPFTMTKSPTVSSPVVTLLAANNIAVESAAEKMAFCPKFNPAKLVAIFKLACSTPFKLSSNLLTSCSSLLKYFTVS